MGRQRQLAGVGRTRRIWIAAALVAAALASPIPGAAAADDTYNGSQLWLRYVPVTDAGCSRAIAPPPGVIVENAPRQGLPPHPQPAVEPGATERLVESSRRRARS